MAVKYLPFTAKHNIRVSESAIHNFQQAKFFSVNNDTIKNDSINSIIFNKIKFLKKQDGEQRTYDLRMECQLFFKDENYTFYIDNRKNIILGGNVYYDLEMANIILENICRPYLTKYFIEEQKYWPNKSQMCNDSLEFLKYFPNLHSVSEPK
jgi:hypothetical protein